MFLLGNHTSDGIVHYVSDLLPGKKPRNEFSHLVHVLVL
ncbi:MAG: hypothetical protein OJF47_002901 [Nitrospira sp.]|nr:MAG: hypothetical protein OJF47_002901 [Nitrospira sp.]